MLGEDFLWEYYIHMGFQNAWAYKELLELEMEKGRVVNVIDHSKMAEELRQRINAAWNDRVRIAILSPKLLKN